MAGQPLCMSQYYKILNSCRMPLPGRDAVKQYTSQDGKHIVVIHNNHVRHLNDPKSSFEKCTCVYTLKHSRLYLAESRDSDFPFQK